MPPVRVVFDSRGRLRPNAALFSNDAPIIVVTSPAAPSAWSASLRANGATVRVVAARDAGRAGTGEVNFGGVDVSEALNALAAEGISSVFCEGGARLANSLMSANRVQRFYLFSAPGKLGDRGVPAFVEQERTDVWRRATRSAQAPEGWRLIETKRLGEDRLLVWSRSTD